MIRSSLRRLVMTEHFLGLRHPAKYSQKLEFISGGTTNFPVFRLMGPDSRFVDNGLVMKNIRDDTEGGGDAHVSEVTGGESVEPAEHSLGDPFNAEEARNIFDTMVRVSGYDSVLYDVQRQGRISFYMQNSGEEALQIGSVAALNFQDMIWPQYRELGVYLYRGFTGQQVTDQCMSTKDDVGKGRQMPVHYCFPEGNIQAVTSPIATQIPQAAGCGYAYRLEATDSGQSGRSGASAESGRVAVAYFGDGATSEGDFAVGLNFAAVRKSQTIFICRNNSYAISTPANEQFASDGIAPRGPAYGIPTARVDGNDIFAVYHAVKEARRICIEQGPVLLELMSYRRGHHSTSDDATRYRPKEELDAWQQPGVDPISRFGTYLIQKGLIEKDREETVRKQAKAEIIKCLNTSEKKKRARVSEMFESVYSDIPWNLQEQKHELMEHIKKNPKAYNSDLYEPEQP